MLEHRCIDFLTSFRLNLCLQEGEEIRVFVTKLKARARGVNDPLEKNSFADERTHDDRVPKTAVSDNTNTHKRTQTDGKAIFSQ